MESIKNNINKLQELTEMPYDICYKVFLDKNKTLLRVLFYIAICLAIYTFITTFKRTLILFCMFAFFIYLYKNVKLNMHVVITSVRANELYLKAL